MIPSSMSTACIIAHHVASDIRSSDLRSDTKKYRYTHPRTPAEQGFPHGDSQGGRFFHETANDFFLVFRPRPVYSPPSTIYPFRLRWSPLPASTTATHTTQRKQRPTALWVQATFCLIPPSISFGARAGS